MMARKYMVEREGRRSAKFSTVAAAEEFTRRVGGGKVVVLPDSGRATAPTRASKARPKPTASATPPLITMLDWPGKSAGYTAEDWVSGRMDADKRRRQQESDRRRQELINAARRGEAR